MSSHKFAQATGSYVSMTDFIRRFHTRSYHLQHMQTIISLRNYFQLGLHLNGIVTYI